MTVAILLFATPGPKYPSSVDSAPTPEMEVMMGHSYGVGLDPHS